VGRRVLNHALDPCSRSGLVPQAPNSNPAVVPVLQLLLRCNCNPNQSNYTHKCQEGAGGGANFQHAWSVAGDSWRSCVTMMGSMHGPTLPGGRGGGRRPRRKPKSEPKAATTTKARTDPHAWPIADVVSKQGDKEIHSEAGYWERRNRKIREQGAAVETPLFRGCRIYFNGRTKSGGIGATRLELTTLVQKNGGIVSNGLSSRISHVVGINTTGTKADQYLRKVCAIVVLVHMKLLHDSTSMFTAQSKMAWHFVTPAWLLDSVAKGKRLPVRKLGAGC